LISYVISFYVIAQFWLVHHRVFRRITGQQEGLAWWNFAFLFTITIMPFTSDLLGEFASNPLAVDIFAANLLLATLATQLTVIYGRRKDLVTAETAQETRAAQFRAAASVVVIALSIGIAWVNPDVANTSGCCLLSRPASPIAGPVANPSKRSSAEPLSRSSRSDQSPRTAAGAYLPARSAPAHPAPVRAVRAAQAQVRADGERAMVSSQ
jgi:Endosomal/lysosomal potassium channel TMEM175